VGLATEQIKQLAASSDARMATASTSIEQTRIVADLGVESAFVVAMLVDDLTRRVEQLENEIKALKRKKEKKQSK
jgi:hypothetical protein